MSYPTVDLTKSIEELEGVTWPQPTLQSYVARTSFELRQKPLRALTDEELRVGLEQQSGLKYIVPLAIERLRAEPLLEARLYGGDLLDSLLSIPAGFWRSHPELRHQAEEVVATAVSAWVDLAERGGSWRDEILPGLQESYDRFTGKLASRPWLRPEAGRAPPLT